MDLGNERRGVGPAVFSADLWTPISDVGPHHRVGDIGHVVLGAQSVEDSGDRVALLAGRVGVGNQYLGFVK